MAYARLTGQDASGTGTTTATATYVGATTAGNLLLAIVGSNSATAAGLSTAGWTSIISNGTGNPNAALFAKIAAGTETAIGATGATNTAICVFEYSGAPSSAATDGTAAASSATGAVTTKLTPSITPVNPNSLIFSVAFVLNAPNATSGLAWTQSTLVGLTTAGGVKLVGGEYLTAGNRSGFTETLNWTGAVNAVTLIAAFQINPIIQPTKLNNYQQLKVGDGLSTSEKIR